MENNNYDLDVIAVSGPFAIGDTKRGRACFQWWTVTWLDEHTLMVSPEAGGEPSPCRIYGRGGCEPPDECWDFWVTEER
jgi:hypothetical protein